ncbi:GTP-binding protein [Pseudarthrobacter sp. NPDC092424]|uniref:GTP-binding protein n=1 Tax=Pseudarthrobacter sp. NPDC092424 TaxID=3364415 RepID=UPI00381B7598
MHLIVVSSLDALCRQQACEDLAATHPESLVVLHDLLENGVVIRRVFGGEGLVEREETLLEHGCLSCAVRLDLVPAVERLSAGTAGPIIIGLPPAVPATVAVTALKRGLDRPPGPGQVHSYERMLACAPDALEDHIWDSHTLYESGFTPVVDDERTPGEFLVGELESADTVLLAEPDIVPAHPAGRDRGLHLIRELAPHTRIAPDPDKPAAMPSPFTTIRQSLERPLHPGRFRLALGTLAEGCCVLRGHLWVASAPECRIAIQGIGPRVWLENVGTVVPDEGRLDAGTVIEATGEDLDPAELAELLLHCQLTDEELAAGLELQDPFGLAAAG